MVESDKGRARARHASTKEPTLWRDAGCGELPDEKDVERRLNY